MISSTTDERRRVSSLSRADLHRLVRRARRALRLPPRELLTTVHVVVVLAAVEVLVRSVSLPRLSRMLGVRVDVQSPSADTGRLPIERLSGRAQRQLRCTWRVADAWPFSRGPCLRRALVGGYLIRDLRPAIRLGVAGAGDELLAHAWLEIDGRPLEAVSSFTHFQRATAKERG